MGNRAYKIRLYPTRKQARQINATLGCSRFVYNKFLSIKKEAYNKNKQSISCAKCSKMLTEMKKEESTDFLNKADDSALRYTLKHLDAAYKNFFKLNRGFPKFKKKKFGKQTYTTQKCWIKSKGKETTIFLGKVGAIHYSHGYKDIVGRVVSGTITKRGYGKRAKYYLSICCEVNGFAKLPQTGENVGLDLGIKTLVTTSDGKKLGRDRKPKRTKKLNKKLKRLQRKLSRKQRGSKNRLKLLSKLNFLYERIDNRKLDKLHKLTKRLVTNYDVICVENLNIEGMRRNKHLAKRLQQIGLGELVRQLEYKCEWYGKQLVFVGRYFPSSQLCSDCGYQNKKVKNLAVREWDCPNCNKHHDRDHNAARNILTEGLQLVQ